MYAPEIVLASGQELNPSGYCSSNVARTMTNPARPQRQAISDSKWHTAEIVRLMTMCVCVCRAFWGFDGHFREQANQLFSSLDSGQQKQVQSARQTQQQQQLGQQLGQPSAKNTSRLRSMSTDRGSLSTHRSQPLHRCGYNWNLTHTLSMSAKKCEYWASLNFIQSPCCAAHSYFPCRLHALWYNLINHI